MAMDAALARARRHRERREAPPVAARSHGGGREEGERALCRFLGGAVRETLDDRVDHRTLLGAVARPRRLAPVLDDAGAVIRAVTGEAAS